MKYVQAEPLNSSVTFNIKYFNYVTELNLLSSQCAIYARRLFVRKKKKGETDRAPMSGASDAFLNELSVEVSSCRFTRWRR